MAKAFGLDISDYSIEALVISGKLNKPKVTSSKRTVLEPGIVKNGEIKRRNGLATKLKQVLAEAKPRKISENDVIVGLPDSRVMTHIFELPGNLKEDQIKGIIQGEIENTFPVELAEISWDYKIISQTAVKMEVFVAAVPKKIVDSLLRVCQDAGLKPAVFELEANALARILIPKTERETSLLIDIGANTTKVSYFDQRGINFISVIDIAGEQFTEKIADKLKMSNLKAKALKKKDGIIMSKGKRKNKVLLAIRSELNNLIKEIERNKEFCENRSGTKINKIILSGGTAMMPGLVEYLRDKMKIEVRIGVELVNLGTKNSRVRGPLFFAVAGLALRGLEKNYERSDLNLLPGKSHQPKISKEKPDKKNKAKIPGEPNHKRTWMLLGILIFGLIILAGILFAYQQGYIGSYGDDKKQAEQVATNQAAEAGQVQEQAASVIFSEATVEIDVSGLDVKKEGTIEGQLNEVTVEGTQTFTTAELSGKTGQLPANQNQVSQTNINLAKEELVKKLVNDNLSQIRLANPLFVVVPEVIDYNITESTTSVSPGTEATQFDLSLKAQPTLLLMSKEQTLQALNKDITNENDKFTEEDLNKLIYKIINYYRNSGIIKLTITQS
ncbi:type IV pilus assembly protein PilM [Patescibacteria group bacterium]|nr:type IV pilus assembly protein PilM [Patescibacteria group bacterium]MBU1672986.1 type IV pilus assembly protein PilM [Patescibacteria group bacterium]MBU1962979.1 type IV pilus assembly protein PilM [Patescibacteria group bacterium]